MATRPDPRPTRSPRPGRGATAPTKVAHVRVRVEAMDVPAPRDGQSGRARHEHLAGARARAGRRPEGHLGEPREVVADRRAERGSVDVQGRRLVARRVHVHRAQERDVRSHVRHGHRWNGSIVRSAREPGRRTRAKSRRQQIQEAHDVVGVAEQPEVWLSALQHGGSGPRRDSGWGTWSCSCASSVCYLGVVRTAGCHPLINTIFTADASSKVVRLGRSPGHDSRRISRVPFTPSAR